MLALYNLMMEMKAQYSPLLVVMSVLVAIFASYVALNLTNSVTQAKGRSRVVWLVCGAIAMGFGIWSMHFVGMLAFEMPGMAMAYDIPLMALSIVVAVVASALALFISSRPAVPMGSMIAGGIAMAAAIAGMHYIGMYSMRMEATIEWDVFLVVLSVVIALVASFAALSIAVRFRDQPERAWQLFFASVVMGIAIAGMHYTGMIAAKFVHDHNAHIESEHLLVTSNLSLVVVLTTILILGLALASSIGQRFLANREKKSADQLTSSEEKFRLLVDAVKDYAIYMLDPSGFVTTWNSGAERIHGYSTQEVLGKHVSTFYITSNMNEGLPGYFDRQAKLAREKGRYESEGLRRRKDGSTFWANVVITPLFDVNGELRGFSKVTRDVTQFKAAEEKLLRMNEDLERRVEERTAALKGREAQLRVITNALPVLVAQVDRNERITFANDAFCKWFGAEDAAEGRMFFRDVLGSRYSANQEFIQRALAGEVVNYERNSESGKNKATFTITFVPEFEDDGQVSGFILVATDIMKYKEIEVELKNARDAAEVANNTKSAFLANMSHEIRTPLGAVLGYSELLLNDEMSPSERANSVEVIKRNGKLLSNIINDILDLSKVEAGKFTIEKVDVPFAEVMAEVGSVLNLEATEKGILLSVTSDGVIPRAIKTDPIRLRQILFNIVGNAIKFTARGSVEVKVQMISVPGGDVKLAFIVKDTGEGIKPEQISKLFVPFSQADVSTTRKFGGTGLGLALSKKLANALGGDVVLTQSEPGVGSTFVITIDPGHIHEVIFSGEQKDLNKIMRLRVPKRTLGGLRVLVVEDSPDNQNLLKKFLRVAGAEVETADNGKEGVEQAMTSRFDVVLMDLQMPIMDGYEATRTLREKRFPKPIIALTAHAMKEERQRCLDNGFNDHLTKPVDRDMLIETLSRYAANVSGLGSASGTTH